MSPKHSPVIQMVSLILSLVFLSGCASVSYCGFKESELEDSFVPMTGYPPRPRVNCDHVVLLDKQPDRKFVEIGIIAPRDIKAKSWANAVNAARAAAALKGADAILLVSEQNKDTWGFGFNSYGGAGGKRNYVTLRCKAIVWQE